MKTKDQDWERIVHDFQTAVEQKRQTFETFREYVADHFERIEEAKEQERLAKNPALTYGEYARRPLIGLRLVIPNESLLPFSLAFRPDWIEPGVCGYRINGIEVKKNPKVGIIECGVVDVALTGPGVKFSITLVKDNVNRHGLYYDSHKNIQCLNLIAEKCHAILMDPFTVFAENALHCINCGKQLDVLDSQQRGIGPECFKYFKHFEMPAVLPVVAKYRQRYRSIDDV